MHLRALFFLAFVASAALGRKYIIDTVPQSEGGYLRATLAEIKSADFLDRYNAAGLSASPTYLPEGHCRFISVTEGVLAVGSIGNPSAFGPYGTNEEIQTFQPLGSPVWFGTLPGGSASAEYIGPLTASVRSRLFTVQPSQLNMTCNKTLHYAVYVRADFGLAGYGSAFPTPPTGAVLASADDLRTVAFGDTYNVEGLKLAPGAVNSGMTGCCIIYTRDGYLMVGTSFFVPYTSSRSSQCSQSSLTFPVYFGTGQWGNYANQYIGQINNTFANQFTASKTSFPSSCNSLSANTWAIYMFRPPVVQPSPAPSTPAPRPYTHDCWEVELQMSYYLPSSGDVVCLADRWHYRMRMNYTYETIKMSSLDECSWPSDIYNLRMEAYTANQVVVSTTGGSQCPCKDYAVVPIQWTSEMTTVCTKREPDFGFCSVLIDIKKNIPCPPPIPSFPPERKAT